MRERLPLTDDQIEAAFLHLGSAADVVFTLDTFQAVLDARAKFMCPGQLRCESPTMVFFDGVQEHSRARRCGLIVVDFGPVRGVLRVP